MFTEVNIDFLLSKGSRPAIVGRFSLCLLCVKVCKDFYIETSCRQNTACVLCILIFLCIYDIMNIADILNMKGRRNA